MLSLNAQIVNIPDANFKTKLLSSNPSNDVAKDLIGNYFTIDANGDNEIQINEAINVSAINVSNANITSLFSLENFINLQSLNCGNNQLTSIEVSGLNNLQNFICSNNQLSILNTTGLNNLQIIDCRFNLLNTLTIGDLSNLQELNCEHNNLTTLNTSGLTNLQVLYCDNNSLTTLNANGLSNLIYLDCTYNQLNTLTLIESNNLQRLECRNNLITTLNMNNTSHLEYLGCQYNNQLTSLYIKNGANESLNANHSDNISYVCADDFQLWEVDSRISNPNCIIDSNCDLSVSEVNTTSNELKVYPNPTKNTLTIEVENVIKNVTIYNMLGQLILVYKTSNIDVSNLEAGSYLVKISTNKGYFNTRFIKE